MPREYIYELSNSDTVRIRSRFACKAKLSRCWYYSVGVQEMLLIIRNNGQNINTHVTGSTPRPVINI